MFDLAEVETAVNEDLELSEVQKVMIASELLNWFDTTPKQAVGDAKVNAFKDRIRQMVSTLSVKFSAGEFVAHVAGNHQTTLSQVVYGSGWFDGLGDEFGRILSTAMT